MDGKKNEVRRTICVWCEKVSTCWNLNPEMNIDRNGGANEHMLTLSTTIMACDRCREELDLTRLSPDVLAQANMSMYRVMIERATAIYNTFSCSNVNVRAVTQMFEPAFMKEPEVMIANADGNPHMVFHNYTQSNGNTIVTQGLVDYRRDILDAIAHMGTTRTSS